MMRAFLAKRNFKGKVKARQDSIRQQSQDEEGAPRAEPAGNDDDDECYNPNEIEEEGEVEGEVEGAEGGEGNDNETAIVGDNDENEEEVEE